MTKFIPYEKLSKRQQREADKKGRGDWGVINPVTRRAEKSTAYNRKKRGQWANDHDAGAFSMVSRGSRIVYLTSRFKYP